MAWNYQNKGYSSAKEERVRRVFFAALFSFVSFGFVVAAILAFSDGMNWVGTRHLAMVLGFAVLAAKGPQLRSSGAWGAKLVLAGAFLVYSVLLVVQVVIPLIR